VFEFFNITAFVFLGVGTTWWWANNGIIQPKSKKLFFLFLWAEWILVWFQAMKT